MVILTSEAIMNRSIKRSNGNINKANKKNSRYGVWNTALLFFAILWLDVSGKMNLIVVNNLRGGLFKGNALKLILNGSVVPSSSKIWKSFNGNDSHSVVIIDVVDFRSMYSTIVCVQTIFSLNLAHLMVYTVAKYFLFCSPFCRIYMVLKKNPICSFLKFC